MPHDVPLIATMAIGLGLACLFGLLAHRLRLPLIAGYLAAGVVIGPFTPGFVADAKIAAQLAEMGVILLMFGVGLHFSFRELAAVQRIAVPGALGQMTVATLAGMGLGWLLGWGLGGGLLFGLALSVASTVVLLRALEERGLLETEQGRVAVGWLVVEDLVMVLALVMVPAVAGLLGGETQPLDAETAEVARMGFGTIGATMLVTLVKVSAFVAIMLLVGQRVIPWVLELIANTKERELFRLSVLAIALVVAFTAAAVFGVSFALGAFFAGMVMAGSTLSAQAAKDSLPFRDAFAVLFFVSVGMLFNPAVIWEQPFSVMVTVLILLGVKSATAYGIVVALGHGQQKARMIAAALAQIGEFSFILIVMGVDLGIVPTEARDLVVAGALVSILVNPLMFGWMEKVGQSVPADAVQGGAVSVAGEDAVKPAQQG
jgi:monovalent cation:H+ antiporter-2, CPA2 family